MIAVLFARADSVYKKIPGCDVWDLRRNATTWPGGSPVVAHPPCALWGRLKHFATDRPGEKELGLWAVRMVREFGGVLEHPAGSDLWPVAGLPVPGARDSWGGFTFAAPQMWFGHKAEKASRFYIVGCSPGDLPPVPFVLGEASHVIAQSSRRQKLRLRPEVTKAEREHTPLALALWLVEVAKKCKKP